jgi:hypothetical protein
MPQRNNQNPIKSGGPQSQGGVPHGGGGSSAHPSGGNMAHCPACKAEVPPKPGFRLSALKCPKCGASMAKR